MDSLPTCVKLLVLEHTAHHSANDLFAIVRASNHYYLTYTAYALTIDRVLVEGKVGKVIALAHMMKVSCNKRDWKEMDPRTNVEDYTRDELHEIYNAHTKVVKMTQMVGTLSITNEGEVSMMETFPERFYGEHAILNGYLTILGGYPSNIYPFTDNVDGATYMNQFISKMYPGYRDNCADEASPYHIILDFLYQVARVALPARTRLFIWPDDEDAYYNDTPGMEFKNTVLDTLAADLDLFYDFLDGFSGELTKKQYEILRQCAAKVLHEHFDEHPDFEVLEMTEVSSSLAPEALQI